MDIVYGHPLTYRFIERLIYGCSYRYHYAALAREIGASDLLELCCGDCQIVDYYRGGRYRGIDINLVFVEHAVKRGLEVIRCDVGACDIPKTACILMHNSLYQFYPRHEALISRALASATEKLIISEPVVNFSSSPNRVVAAVARRLTNMGGSVSTKRFNRAEAEEIFQRFGASKIEFLGRNLMAVIPGGATQY